MFGCKDPFLSVLKKFGYCVVRLPRTELPPLYLLGGRGSELDRIGALTTVLTGGNPPPVHKDVASVTITGEQSRTSDLDLKLGVSLLGNVIAAMGGSRVGLEAQYQAADTVSFEFVDVLEDSVEVALLDQYLGRAKIHPDNRHIARMLARGQIYVITSVIKSKKLVVRAKSSKSGAVKLDVPVVEQMVGGSVKVSAAVGEQAALQYEGPVPLVFGFQAVRLLFREGAYESFERLAAGAAASRSLEPDLAAQDKAEPLGIGKDGIFANLSIGTPFAQFTGEGTGRRALLIGINKYPKLPPRAQLKGCVADVELMRDTLINRFGFPVANVRVLTDDHARRDSILEALDKLVTETQPEDTVFIQYSGHGSQVKDREGDEPNGWDDTIVPSDSGRDGNEIRDITDDEIYSRLLDLSAKTGNITLWFDSCHSGGISRDAFGGATRGIEPAPKDATLPEASISAAARAALIGARSTGRGGSGLLPIDHSYVLLAGCRSEQLSYEHTTRGPDGASVTNGALTYFLHRELVGAEPGATYRDVFDAARRQVTAAYPTQQPQMEGAADRVLFGTERRETMPFLPVVRVEGVTVALGGGAAHAVTVGSVWTVYPPTAKQPDPAAVLGRVTITEVAALTSIGTLVPAPGSASVVVGCRATEETRAAADPRLPVEVSDLTGTGTAAADNLRALIGTEKLLRVVPSGGNVRVYAVPAGDPASRGGAVPTAGTLRVPSWVAVGRDGQIIGSPAPMGDPVAVNRLIKNLAAVSRFQNVLALTNTAADNPLRDKVQLTLLRKGSNGKWIEAAPEPDGRVVFTEGPLGLRFTNVSSSNVFVTALDFGLTHGITQLFPRPESQPALQPGPYDYPPDTDGPIELYFPEAFPADITEGIETIKLLVTSEPADFRWFQQPGVRSKDVLGAASPLELLLEWADRGETRDGRPPGATKTTNWTTVERTFTLRRK
jgi:hypothetical protein